jgi:hypothetical protein
VKSSPFAIFFYAQQCAHPIPHVQVSNICLRHQVPSQELFESLLAPDPSTVSDELLDLGEIAANGLL